jgi:Ser/Thr protein kinase RdoA (MazF antagonist)
VPPHDFRIRTYDDVLPHCAPGFAHPEPRVLFDGLDDRLMPPARRELFRQVGERVQAEIDRLFAAGSPQPIHNDLHPWNVMVAGSRLQALDFENCLMGFPVQDVGTTLHYVQHHFEKKMPFAACRTAFRRGYESERAWPEEYPGQVDTMTAGHRLLLCNFYASHRDAEFREFGVGFIARMEARLRDYPGDA